MTHPYRFRPSRRNFIETAGSAALASLLPASTLLASTKTAAAHSTAAGVKYPLPSPAAFEFLPLGSIQPTGWLLDQLRIQARGLGGHLDEIWADVGPNSGWLGGTGESWERGPYFLDGLVPLAWLLDDEQLKAKAQRYMEWTLTHPGADGMIGPATNNDWWPRMVMLKALTQYHEFTGDARVLTVMEVYFQHQLSALPGRPLRDWGRFRWQDEVVSVLWLYQRTGQPYLLDLARLLHTQGFDWQALFNNFPYTHRITAEFIKLNQGDGLKDLALSTHGVNNGQAIKAAAVWSLLSGSADDRSASLKMIATLEKYHGLPNGMFSCDEHLAGLNPSQGSELCTVVETMFSLEQCLAITGNPSFADRLEKLAFNALPGTLTDTMWAHQYNQEPNQVECSLHRQPWTTDGPESNLFGLEPNFGCCTANFHQGWPKLVSALFLRTGGSGNQASHGLVATVYAPCELHTELNGVPLRIVETTNYPFRGAVRIAIEPARPLSFALSLRIPAWAGGATIRINGKPAPDAAPETFARIERTWKAGDVVELAFPTEPRVSRWFNNSVAIERGPLVFSFGIGESWVKLRERGQASDWQVFPSTPWNYALRLDLDKPAGSIQVVESPLGPAPFARSQAPVRLHVKARQLDSWRAEDGVAAPPPPSPVAATGPEQTLELIPYAAAKLRVTAFPLCKEA